MLNSKYKFSHFKHRYIEFPSALAEPQYMKKSHGTGGSSSTTSRSLPASLSWRLIFFINYFTCGTKFENDLRLWRNILIIVLILFPVTNFQWWDTLKFYKHQIKSIDIEISEKTALKVSSILLSIPLPKSIVDTDIDTPKVSSILSMSISIFDINNPDDCDRVLTVNVD